MGGSASPPALAPLPAAGRPIPDDGPRAAGGGVRETGPGSGSSHSRPRPRPRRRPPAPRTRAPGAPSSTARVAPLEVH